MLYHSLINSHLLYCLPVWSCGLESTLTRLIKMQKRAIRIVTNKRYNSHTVPIFKDLEILPLKESAIYTKILFIYDYINGKLPESFLNIWLKRRDLNPRILRNLMLKNLSLQVLKDFQSLIFKIYGIRYVIMKILHLT